MSRSDGAAGGVQGEECRAVLAWFGAGAAIKNEKFEKKGSEWLCFHWSPIEP